MPDKVYAIDANVVLRYVKQEGGHLQEKTEWILDAVADGRLTASCDPVTLAEVVWVLESFYQFSRAQISAALEPFLQCDNFLMPHKQRYQEALRLYATTVPDLEMPAPAPPPSKTAMAGCSRLIASYRGLMESRGWSR